MLDFIVNPLSGGVNGKKMQKNVKLVQQRLLERNIEYKFHFTEYPRHAVTLTEQLIDGGATTIVVMGGDGTLHEVINGFKNFDTVSLGIIPCGTGNDFASALNLPSNPVKALDFIIDGQPQYTDYMQMPSVRGINIIGMGIDVEVLQYYYKHKKRNKLTYTLCLIKALFNFKYKDFTATIDGEEMKFRSFVAGIANGCKYGGGIPLCPPATPIDNKLNFIAIKEIAKIKIIGAFLKLKAGKVLKIKEIIHLAEKEEIKIHSDEPCVINVDGELYENIPFEIKIVPNKLRVFR